MEALKGKPVFNVRDAERHLLLARDLPGYDVRLGLRPAATAPGEVVGEVQSVGPRVGLEINVQTSRSNADGRFGGPPRRPGDRRGGKEPVSSGRYGWGQE